MKLVVLAAGAGTRMGPLTRRRPKVLLPVAGRPLVEHLVRNASAAGFRDILFVVGHEAAQVRDHFGDGTGFDATIEYVDQAEPHGTGHAVAALDGHVDGPFVLAAGDAYFAPADLKALRKAKDVAIGARNAEDARPYGLLQTNDDRLVAIKEKPQTAAPGLVNTGAYRLDEDVIAACKKLKPSPRGELELTDAVAGLDDVRVVECPSWRDVGRPWDLLNLQEELMRRLETDIRGDVGDRVDLDGSVVVAEGARVRNGTTIEGPVVIGPDARIGPNAYLRPATAIGARCHVGAGVEVKNSILMDDANVPHLSYVGDSVLAGRVNLGAGTQVANLKHTDTNVRVHWEGKEWVDTGRRKFGAILSDGAKTGVNASLNPGTVLGVDSRVAAGAAVTGWVKDGAFVGV